MLDRIKSQFIHWAYADKNREYYKTNQESICRLNLNILGQTSKLVLALLLIIIFFIAKVIKDPYLIITYVCYFFINILSYCLSVHWKNRPFNFYVMDLFYVLYLQLTGIFGILVSVFFNPNMIAGFIMIIIIGQQLLFLLPPIYSITSALSCCILFSIGSFIMKDSTLALTDLCNAVSSLILGAFLCWNIMKIRVEETFVKNQMILLNQKLEKLSTIDELTQLLNRRSFNLTYDKIFLDCRLNQRNLTVMMMDIDSYKSFNDNYGHLKGDDCLKEIGKALNECIREKDITIYRYGGEEFIAVSTSLTQEEGMECAQNICNTIENLCVPHAYSKSCNVVTISIGVYYSKVEMDSQSFEFLNNADCALYQAKKNGGNCISSFDLCNV